MRIAMIASEMSPLAKTGGLADVLGHLPYALADRGHDVSVWIPYYQRLKVKSPEFLVERRLQQGDRSVQYRVFRLFRKKGVEVFGIQKEEYFDRSELYGLSHRDYEDNAVRFSFFCQAVVQCIPILIQDVDVLHCHDWHTALVPAYWSLWKGKGASPHVRTVFTIHNFSFQGIFPFSEFRYTQLPSELFSMDGIEFYGQLNFMKAGLQFSDVVTTVSQRYAEEILTPEFGCLLDPCLRSLRRPVLGIVNGVDYDHWDPEHDRHLAAPFGKTRWAGKSACKLDLLKRLRLIGPRKWPVFGIVSRFASQKGMDLILEAIPSLMKRKVMLTILGNGDPALEEGFKRAAREYPDQIGLKLGFDEALAHRIFAGSDFFLMPSRFEPCGLAQLYAMRYGSIPIVRATGGLEDTVIDYHSQKAGATGFKFTEVSATALLDSVDRALDLYGQSRRLQEVRKTAISTSFSWEDSAAQYEQLYQSLN
jgi:starch synthase